MTRFLSKIKKSLDILFRDARDFQIIYLSAFLVFGIWFLDWDAEMTKFISIIATCLITQAIFSIIYKVDLSSLKSGMITALGLCIILKANSEWTLVLASFVAISSKFIIRYNGKHIFNPSLFGIIFVILFTGDAWISPGQWGHETLMVLFFVVSALIVLFKVGRLDVSFTFLGTLMALEFAYTYLYQGWTLDVYFHSFTSGTILLFAFFMITDPKTTPNSRRGRMIYAASIGTLTFILSAWFESYTAPIWALLMIAPVTVVLDQLYKADRFKWLAIPKTALETEKVPTKAPIVIGAKTELKTINNQLS